MNIGFNDMQIYAQTLRSFACSLPVESFFDIDIEDVSFDAPQIEECINFHLQLLIEQFNRDAL